MSNQELSASLQIVQAIHANIQISQNSFQIQQNNQKKFISSIQHEDTFQLSLDQNSLSFQIQEVIKQIKIQNVLKEEDLNSQVEKSKSSVLKNDEQKPTQNIQQQRKRKRKQIFEKYKQKSTENLVTGPDLQINSSSNLLNTFDEVFKIKSPEKKSNEASSTQKNLQKSQQNIKITAFKKKQSIATSQLTSFQQFPSVQVSQKLKLIKQALLMKGQNWGMQLKQKTFAKQGSMQQFLIPSNILLEHNVNTDYNLIINSTNSFLVDGQKNRISMIQTQFMEQQFSIGSVDLQALLKSQIFREQVTSPILIGRDQSYKNIQISMVKPSIMLKNQDSNDNFKNINLGQRLGLTRDKSEAFLQPHLNKPLLSKCLSDRKLLAYQHLKEQITIKKQNFIVYVKQNPVNSFQNRISIYLREIRKRNTVIPNFYIKSKSQQSLHQENRIFKQLLDEFKKALIFLDFVNEVVSERHTHMKKKQNILLNSMILQTFVSCGWQKSFQIKQLDRIKSYESFFKREYVYQKVKGALNNYLYIVQYYEKGNLNLIDQKAQKKYIQIRAKFWQIEKNIKMIGEDIYLTAVQTVFPLHYYEFLNLLKGNLPKFQSQSIQLQYLKKLLAQYYHLKKSGDILCLSEIGRYLKNTLQKMIKRGFLI